MKKALELRDLPLEELEALAALLNSGLVPAVHEFGSLGCSGDLAPLAHVALVLRGEGHVLDGEGATRPAGPALAQPPVPLRMSTRAMAMGGANFLSAEAIEAGFWNPATFWWRWMGF